jgi:hypothetical protein
MTMTEASHPVHVVGMMFIFLPATFLDLMERILMF